MGEILEQILGRYVYKEDLQDLCDELDLPVSGSKDELIQRLLEDEDFEPESALEYLDKEELKALCDELEISSAGTRDALFARVLDLVEAEESEGEAQEETERIRGGEESRPAALPSPQEASTSPESRPARQDRRREFFGAQQPVERPFELPNLPPASLIPEPHAPQIAQLQMVCEFIDSYRPSRRFRVEQAYEIEMSEAMRHRFGQENVKTQVSIYGGRIDVEVLGIGVEIKVPENRSQLYTLLGQIASYRRFYGPNLVVVIFNDLAKVQDVTEFSNVLRDGGIRVFVK